MTTKLRIEVKPNDVQNAQTLAATGPGTPVNVVDETSGPVTFLDKLKGYYHTLIVVIGSVLVILNEVTPVLNFLPDNGKQWVTGAIAVLTIAATALKSNEHWVDDL